jgi:GTP-binding protein EngB required for normal cell division
MATITPSQADPGNDSAKSPLFDKLLTADQSLLLDTVDELRSHGVSQHIELPQIIVCGDQSTGKSSVLEAISRISFPRDEALCTTFPTELALRRAPSRKVNVRLNPNPSRQGAERASLLGYKQEIDSLESFQKVVSDAKAHLQSISGEGQEADSFFEDTLHIEVTDPQWPPLSLVDLPGLISSENPRQAPKNARIPEHLCAKYMSNTKSIILAVIAANYDPPIQKVWSLIRQYDPLGRRTLCVFTKPDRVEIGPESRPKFVEYAMNTQPGYQFLRDWHIVRNSGPESKGQSVADRDTAEDQFFAQSSWTKSLHRDQLGISKLRERLSSLLEQHTQTEMPKVINDINGSLEQSREALKRLGPGRSTINEQRLYLTQKSLLFQSVIQQAVNGYYDDESFFLPSLPATDPRRLRAAVQNLNEAFAEQMHQRGHAVQLITNGDYGKEYPYWPELESLGALENDTLPRPRQMARSTYIEEIKILARKDKGRELIGTCSPRLVSSLFRKQSKPWRMLATNHLEVVWRHVSDHLGLVADHVTTVETAAALRRHLIYDNLDRRHQKVMAKLEELLKPHESGHPVTYDKSYIQNARKLAKDDVRIRLMAHERVSQSRATEKGAEPQPPGLQIHQVLEVIQPDKDEIDDAECANILNCMRAYYDVSLPSPSPWGLRPRFF